MKAEAHLRDVAYRVRRGTKTDGRVHLAGHAFGTPFQSELDRAVAQMRLELMNGQKGLSIHIDINAADTFAIAAGSELYLL